VSSGIRGGATTGTWEVATTTSADRAVPDGALRDGVDLDGAAMTTVDLDGAAMTTADLDGARALKDAGKSLS
jgi:uncharacterized protein YjbI with pentapeptide repeats